MQCHCALASRRKQNKQGREDLRESLQDREVYLLRTCPITRARLRTRITIAWVDRTDVGHYDAWAVLSGQRHSAYESKTGRSQKAQFFLV